MTYCDPTILSPDCKREDCKKCAVNRATPKNSGWEERLFELIREGHEAVINEEEVDEYKAKVKSFIRSLLQERSKDTVGSLIEKMGDRFISIIKLPRGRKGYVGSYYKKGTKVQKFTEICATPLEALQKLSEQLNQK